jgi:predicted CopG family antitoxin
MPTRTTINIRKDIREILKQMRKYPRETYDDVLARELKPKLRKIMARQKKILNKQKKVQEMFVK